MSWPWKIALSLAWGLLLAGGVALHAGVALWLLARVFIYGDTVFPDSFEKVFLLGVGGAALLSFATVAVLIFNLRRLSAPLDARLATSAVLRWTILAVPLLIMTGAVWAYERQQADLARSSAALQALERRRAEAHRLTSAEWRLDRPAGRLFLSLAADGAAEGSYALFWQARGTGEPVPVGSASSSHRLGSGPARLTLDLDAAALARSYAEAVLSRPETVQIDVTLTIELGLAREEDSATGQRPQLQLTVPLSYRYGADGSVEFSSPPS